MTLALALCAYPIQIYASCNSGKEKEEKGGGLYSPVRIPTLPNQHNNNMNLKATINRCTFHEIINRLSKGSNNQYKYARQISMKVQPRKNDIAYDSS